MGKHWRFLAAACACALAFVGPVAAQEGGEDPVTQLAWQVGPTDGQITSRAHIRCLTVMRSLGRRTRASSTR